MDLFENISGYDVFGWSVSGNETTVVIKNKMQRVNFCFDIGISTPQNVNCNSVFISHGHIDHVAGLPLHVRKRMLNKLPPANYYLPMKLVNPMKNICQSFSEMHECDNNEQFQPNLIGVESGNIIKINDKWKFEVISTPHRTEISLGYLLYNTDISEVRPEISYLGDTTFQAFYPNPIHDNLLTSKIIITELTYIDISARRQEAARNYGHTSLADFKNMEQIFSDVENIVFVHFSARYKAREMYPTIESYLPKLKHKIWCLLSAQNSLY